MWRHNFTGLSLARNTYIDFRGAMPDTQQSYGHGANGVYEGR